MQGLALYLFYLRRFYRAKTLLLALSVTGLAICYLTLEIVFSFGSIAVKKADQSYEAVFAKASLILSPPGGLRFDQEGKLQTTQLLDSGLVKEFTQTFDQGSYNLINGTDANGQSGVALVEVQTSISYDRLLDFCKRREISLANSYYQPDSMDRPARVVLYNISGSGNRFTIYPFATQLSAAILSRELSSEIGRLSQLLYITAAIFTLYITLLYYRERKTEYALFIIQGYTDLNLKITLTDCVLQNVAAFAIATTCTLALLSSFTASSADYRAALGGFLYLLPWLPLMIIAQLLLLLNQAIRYAASFR